MRSNHKRVLRLMRQERLLCHKKKFKPVTTDSTHGLPIYPNLLKGREITGLNQAWASDITYVQLQHEHIFLAVVLDLYSRKCIVWELIRSIRSDLAMSALAKALKNRTTESLEGLIHHSDQGVQYASNDYVDCLRAHNIQISMSRKGNPYDNAFAESFVKRRRRTPMQASGHARRRHRLLEIEEFKLSKAFAFFFCPLVINILFNYFRGYAIANCSDIATFAPKMPSPKLLLNIWESLKQFSCDYAFYNLHNFRRRISGCSSDENMNMVSIGSNCIKNK